MRTPTCFWGHAPQTTLNQHQSFIRSVNARTLVSLLGLADPRCHYQILRILQMGCPAHDRHLPIPCNQSLSQRISSDAKRHVRRCEGRQAISFEEGCVANIEVEFTHSKVMIGLDRSTSYLDLVRSRNTRCRRVSSKTRTTTSSPTPPTISTGCTLQRAVLTKGLRLGNLCFRCDLQAHVPLPATRIKVWKLDESTGEWVFKDAWKVRVATPGHNPFRLGSSRTM